MNIIQVYKRYPTQQACIEHLESVRWPTGVGCVYCNSSSVTPRESKFHHCNSCNRSFSVTTGTVFHKTRCDLQKWFLAITLLLNAKKGYAARQIARDLEVTKDTAWYMLMRIRKAMVENSGLLNGIVEADESFMGGKNKNRRLRDKIKHTQGRSTKLKAPVLGAVSRSGRIIARSSVSTSYRCIDEFMSKYVAAGATLITDEWQPYGKLTDYDHRVINHRKKEYVRGEVHTNTIESFWALFKRGYMGMWHHITRKYLDEYLTEFCFRHNNRKHPDAFGLVIENALNISL